RKLPMSAEELLEAAVLIYLNGLGFPGDAAAAGRLAEFLIVGALTGNGLGANYVNVINIHSHLTYTMGSDMELAAKLDDIGKPAWIGLMVLAFIVFWPLGLAVLAYLIWSGRMACWK